MPHHSETATSRRDSKKKVQLHTKKINDLGGLASKMPNFALVSMILVLGSVGLPGTSGFVGEFLAIIGAFKSNKIIAIVSASGVVLGACYMLWLYKRVWFSEITNQKINKLNDIKNLELLSFLLIAVIVIILGVYPNLVIKYFTVTNQEIVKLFLVK
jgi:NADH-quinone oxidoreductase subunit M